MAKSLDKKKPSSTLYEYGDKPLNFYNMKNAKVANEMIPTANTHHAYYIHAENTGFKKTTKGNKRNSNRIIDGPQNVY